MVGSVGVTLGIDGEAGAVAAIRGGRDADNVSYLGGSATERDCGWNAMPMTSELGIKPGVALIIHDGDGSLLLHRRRVGNGWAPISGRVEPGESVLAAAHREAREETNLDIRIVRFIGVYSAPPEQIVRYSDGREVQFVTTLFSAEVAGGVFAGSAEGREWGWFEPDRLPTPLLDYAETWLNDALSGTEAPYLR